MPVRPARLKEEVISDDHLVNKSMNGGACNTGDLCMDTWIFFPHDYRIDQLKLESVATETIVLRSVKLLQA